MTLVLEGLDAQNYQSAYTATLKVIATPMTGNWTETNVVADYDGASHAAAFTADGGLTEGVDFEIRYALKGTGNWTTDAPVNAGEYVAKAVSLNAGYSSDRLTTATVTINKKVVTINANGVENGVYSGAEVDPATMFTSPQGVGDDVLTLEYTITKGDAPVDEIKDAGIYKVVARLVDESGNYTATACETTYTVNPAEVSVTWTGENSVVFSGEVYEPTFETTGLIGNDVISVTYTVNDGASLTDGKARNAGRYTATAVLPSDNYVFASDAQQSFAFEITKVTISVELKGDTVSVEYGDGYMWNLNDFYGDVETNSELLEAYLAWSMQNNLTGIETAKAGTKYEAAVEMRIRYKDGDDLGIEDIDNFELVSEVDYIVVYVKVVAKKITVTATDGYATYDGEKVSEAELLETFSVGIDVAVTINVNDTVYDYADIKNVGSYAVSVASANANYEFIGDTDATFTVKAADMTDVAVTGYGGEYDNAAHGAVVNASATTVDDSEVIFTYSTSEGGVYGDAPEFTNAGVYTVWYKATAANHNEEIGSFTVTIAKVVVDLPEIKSKSYNGETQTATVAESDLYTVTKNEGGINAGDYEVTIELKDKANYAWVSGDEDKDGVVTLKFTIEKVSNAWTTEPSVAGWTYGETANDVQYEAKFGNETAVIRYRSASEDDSAYSTVVPTQAGNYYVKVTIPETDDYGALESDAILFTIAKADYDMSGVSFENKTVTYDGTTQTISVNGTLPTGADGVQVTVTYGAGIKDVGSTVVTATFATESGNYNVPEAMTATLTITAKKVAVVWSNTELIYNGEAQAPSASVETGISGETIELVVSGAAIEAGTYTATAAMKAYNGNYELTGATVQFTVVQNEVVVESFTVGYGTITVGTVGGTQGIEYSVNGGAWTPLPENGVITVDPAASWTIKLRYAGQTAETSHVVYTSAANVVTYLNDNLSENAIENKEIIATAEAWLATAVGDKTEANAKLGQAKAAYEAAADSLGESVENALKATANLTSRAVAAIVAVAAVSVLGIAVGAIALRRKGGKKNENK